MSDENNEKIKIDILAAMPVEDSCFAEVFLSIRSLGIFYGTDNKGQRDSCLLSIQKALDNRIGNPVVKWCEDPHTCFFKPYTKPIEGINAFVNGFFTPVCTLISGLGLLWAATNPVWLLIQLCGPAIIELCAGLVSLGQALWYQVKAVHYESAADQEEADAYFLDALTRFALTIPLAVASLIATPLDFVRFLTRAIATLIDVTINDVPQEKEPGPNYPDMAARCAIDMMF
jgi:hypothetical protein